WTWIPYLRGPCFYNSFVHCDIARSLKRKTGLFFHSITPDVYSSLAALSQLKEFVYSTRPFSIRGASHHSIGVSWNLPDANSNHSPQCLKELMSDGIDRPIHSE